jgi:hypothetical protein
VCEFALNLLKAEINPDVDFSKRTSVHVHLDVRQMTMNQLVGLLFTYSVVENLLFKFVQNNRRNNIFCVPINETYLMSNMKTNPDKFLYAIESYWQKYSALNLLPISRQGSVEFRHMPGTLNVPLLIQWIDLLCCLKVFAYKYSFKSILDRIVSLNSNSRYREFISDVFPDRLTYLDTSNLLSDMENAVYLIKHCAMANEFDTFIQKNPTNNSQLGRKIFSFITKLPKEHADALLEICKIVRNFDHERVFREVIRNPEVYRKHDPRLAQYVDIILTARAAQKKPKKPKPNPGELTISESLDTYVWSATTVPYINLDSGTNS